MTDYRSIMLLEAVKSICRPLCRMEVDWPMGKLETIPDPGSTNRKPAGGYIRSDIDVIKLSGPNPGHDWTSGRRTRKKK